MPSCCPICNRVGLESLISPLANETVQTSGQLQNRFFRLLMRFTNCGSENDNNGKCRQLPPVHFPFEQFNEIGLLSCEECLKHMESFCYLYNQMKTIELRITWKVETLKNALKAAQRVPSRINYFRECVIGNLEGGSKSQPETEMNADEVICSVTRFRKSLIEKCSRTVNNSFPKLVLEKYEPNGGKRYPATDQTGTTAMANDIPVLEIEGSSISNISSSKKRKLSNDNDDDLEIGDPRTTLCKMVIGDIEISLVDKNHHEAVQPELTDVVSSPRMPVNECDDKDEYSEDNASVPIFVEIEEGQVLNSTTMIKQEDCTPQSVENISVEEIEMSCQVPGFGIVAEEAVSTSAQVSGHSDPAPQIGNAKVKRIHWRNNSSCRKASRNCKVGQPFRLKCPDCSLLFESTELLLRHRKDSESSCGIPYDPKKSIKVKVLVTNNDTCAEEDHNFSEVFATIYLPLEMHSCEICNIAIYSSKDLEEHKLLHGTFSCPFCSFGCSYAPDLASHELQHFTKESGDKGRICCARCDFASLSGIFNEYIHHHLREHLNLSFNQPKCAICKTHAMKLRDSTLGEHFKTQHDLTKASDMEGVRRCRVRDCNAYFLTSRQLTTHVKMRHNPQFSGRIRSTTKRLHKEMVPKLRCRSPDKNELPESISIQDLEDSTFPQDDCDIEPLDLEPSDESFPQVMTQVTNHQSMSSAIPKASPDNTASKDCSQSFTLIATQDRVQFEDEFELTQTPTATSEVQTASNMSNITGDNISTGRRSGLRNTHSCPKCRRTFTSSVRLQLHLDDEHDHDDENNDNEGHSDSLSDNDNEDNNDMDDQSLSFSSSSSEEDEDDFEPEEEDNESDADRQDPHGDSDVADFPEVKVQPQPGAEVIESDSKLPIDPVSTSPRETTSPTSETNAWGKGAPLHLGRRPCRNPRRAKKKCLRIRNREPGRPSRLKCPDCAALFDDMKSILLHRKNAKSCSSSYDPMTSIKVEIYAPVESSDHSVDVHDDNNFTLKIATIDLPQAVFTCNICKLAVFSSEDMEEHKKLHGLFPCKFCKSKFRFATELACHELRHARKSCSRCEFKIPARPKCYDAQYVHHFLWDHLSLKWNEPKCAICKTNPRGLLQLEMGRHYKTHHDISNMTDLRDLIRCPTENCDAYYISMQQLNDHLRLRHNIVPDPRNTPGEKNCVKHKCKDCDKSFFKLPELKQHRLRRHIGWDKAIPCSVPRCPKAFESKKDLEAHMRYATVFHKSLGDPANDKAPVNCPKCNKLVSGKHPAHLRMHLEAHKSDLICEVCGKIFKIKDTLDTHRLSHTGPESWKYECSVCSKKCISKQKLNEHMRTHTKDKPFVCQICGQKYAHRHNLRIHVNSKHGDVVQDIPRKCARPNLTSRKGIKRKKVEDKDLDSSEIESD